MRNRLAFCTMIALALYIVISLFSKSADSADNNDVCKNRALIRAVRIINDACNDISCDFNSLRELDLLRKDMYLAALKDPYLNTIHLFFPKNEWKIDMCFDWNARKRDQIKSLSYITDIPNSTIFVIGQASVTGGFDHNVELSRRRMQSVMYYLKNLGLQCRSFKGGYLGKEIMQLSPSDAAFLNIPTIDFRNDDLILNQAVHIFALPCQNVL